MSHSTMPAHYLSRGATEHAPWCTSHRVGGQHVEDGFCMRPAPSEHSDVYLTNTDDGPAILAYAVTRDEFTLDQAEAYARALLDLVAAGRGQTSGTTA
ncbi:hypothetical protein [Streptosporangium sp. NPDC002524]|uniref:hypothetical protein n=1 Tax=Streptosporangium sp. NPDC002524 TaxID=3154537 RepID=UPI00331B157C